MAKSKIEWLAIPGTKPESWNPMTGCKPISPGCQNCYAQRLAHRLKRMGQPKYRDAFEPTFHPAELERPCRWRKPRTVFVCSMSDLFHDAFTDGQVDAVLSAVCALSTRDHTFILLTKRPERMVELTRWELPPRVWVGVTVEHPDQLWRLDHLRQVPAAVRYVSIEPLLGDARIWYEQARPSVLDGIDWVIVGAETGPHKREMSQDAAIHIRDLCKYTGVPFFFKKNYDGSRLLDGRMHEEWPI